jgi:tRNA A-37 threonylcarbamoyl transferase component Bud32/ligand-binding sensor domain-containing protein
VYPSRRPSLRSTMSRPFSRTARVLSSLNGIVRHLLRWGLLALTVQTVFGQQYPFLSLSGSPKNVRTMFQDSQGRLWLGGEDLTCFDGTRFFSLRDYGFPAAHTYSITEDASGVIWIGAESGVYRFAHGRVEEVSKGVGVSVIAASPDMVVVAMGAAGRGLPVSASLVRIRRTGNAWTSDTVMDLNSPGALTLDRNGLLLYPWPQKGWSEIRLQDVLQWRPGTQISVAQHEVPNAPGAGLMRYVRDRSGCVWIASEGTNRYQCDQSGWHDAPFAGAEVRSTPHEGADGSMVLSGYSMIAIGRPGSFRIATLANGLPGLFDAMLARDGTAWLAGPQGVYRFASPFRLEHWTAHEGVDVSFALTRSGQNMFGGFNRSVAVLSKDRQRWQTLTSFAKVGEVTGLMSAGDGTILAALNRGGAFELSGDGRILARTADGVKGPYGLRLAKTPEHETWLGGFGLFRMKREGSTLNLQSQPLQTQPASNVLDIQYEDHTRKLWACYKGGLAVRNEDQSWREITTKDGLLINPCWSLAALPNGDVWYGYYNTHAFALIRPDGKGGFAVKQYRDEVRDPQSYIFDVDQRGWLWRGGDQGISVADPADAEAGRWVYFDQSDGLPGQGANSGSYFADADGSVWWGGDITVSHFFPPADLVAPKFSPQVFISAFSWKGASPRLAESVEGIPRGSNVVAHVGSLQFDRRNSLRLRYRILPGQDWRESSSLDLPLGKLSWGSHTLEVQGRVFTGPWSATASRTFRILRPIWLSWPFLLAYTIGGSTLVAGGYWMRRRRTVEEASLPNLATWRLQALLPEVHELAGQRLDARYTVGDLLARGGFANVMDGYDHDQNRRCAIKVFRSELTNKEWITRRFKQEVAALQQVRHPHVVAIYAHGVTPSGVPYLVMEFVEGKSLRENLEDGAVPPARLARLLRQLASALDAIHRQNICHRDVKPENLMIRNAGNPDEQLVLIDFSISIVKDANETLHGLSRAAGSFEYMAPEQAIGYAQPSSDVYSLAKVIIEMLTGQRLPQLLPDAALDLADRVRDLLRDRGGLSEESIELLSRALEFDPQKRPDVASAVANPVARDLEGSVRARA